MAEGRRDNTEILVAIGNLQTKFEECTKPAIEQTYRNEKDIIRIKAQQSLTKWIGGTVALAFIVTAVRSAYTYITKHPH